LGSTPGCRPRCFFFFAPSTRTSTSYTARRRLRCERRLDEENGRPPTGDTNRRSAAGRGTCLVHIKRYADFDAMYVQAAKQNPKRAVLIRVARAHLRPPVSDERSKVYQKAVRPMGRAAARRQEQLGIWPAGWAVRTPPGQILKRRSTADPFNGPAPVSPVSNALRVLRHRTSPRRLRPLTSCCGRIRRPRHVGEYWGRVGGGLRQLSTIDFGRQARCDRGVQHPRGKRAGDGIRNSTTIRACPGR